MTVTTPFARVLLDQAHSSAWSIDPELAERMNPANPGDASLARAAAVLRERGTDDLTRVTLMSDGASVYECTSQEEVIDLVQGGQGVFGIAVGRVWREVEGSLLEIPSERMGGDDEAPTELPGDELSARRRAKLA